MRFIIIISWLLLSFPNAANAQSIDWLNGNWSGRGYQTSNNGTWEMTFSADVENEIYTIEYPSLSCGGSWELQSADDTRLVFKEVMAYGQLNCVNLGKVIITYVDENHISFSYFWPGRLEVDAYCTLTRLPVN